MKRKLCVAAMAMALLTAAPAAQAADFSDVAPTAWYGAMVGHAVEDGLMYGVAPGRFAPESMVTRAELTAVLWNLAGRPAAERTAAFPDVPPDAWYHPALDWAAACGIVDEGDCFVPQEPVSRQQTVTAFARFAESTGIDTLSSDALSEQYVDAPGVEPDAREAFAWAVEENLITGTDAYHLSPQAPVTRAQLAAISVRYEWKTLLRDIVHQHSFPAIHSRYGGYEAAYYDGNTLVEKRWLNGEEQVALAMGRQNVDNAFYYYDYGREALWESRQYGIIYYVNASGQLLTNAAADPLDPSSVFERPVDLCQDGDSLILTTMTKEGIRCIYQLDGNSHALERLTQQVDDADGNVAVGMEARYYFDGADPEVSAFLARMHEELTAERPMRTVTVVLNPGQEDETVVRRDVPAGRYASIILPDGYREYADAACTVPWQGNENLSASVTVYAVLEEPAD